MITKAFSKLARLIIRIVQIMRIAFYRLISTNKVHGKPRTLQPIHALGLGKISINNKATIGYFPSPRHLESCCYLDAHSIDASISIHAGTHINNGFTAIAEFSSITIGKNCLIGTNVEIIDSDFHGIHPNERTISNPNKCRPVIIENDVFIASNVKIMKGVRIGQGSVVANGSVVVKDIPPMTIVGGNPATLIRKID